MGILIMEKQRYNLPPVDIISGGNATQRATIPDPDGIATALTRWGIPCHVLAVDVAPQIVTYHLNFADPLLIARMKKPLAALSAVLHTPATLTTSARGHCAIVIARAERAILPIQAILPPRTGGNPHTVYIGVNGQNAPVKIDLTRAPHLLVAGATGAGKSNALAVLLAGLLWNASPNSARMILIDTKQTELTPYNGVPHLLAPPVVTTGQAVKILAAVVDVMRNRFRRLRETGAADISATSLPRVYVVVDELADVIGDILPDLLTLAQLGRAAGIHLIIATQRPTVDIIPGALKANIPARLALQTASAIDSRVIIDRHGAERLTGRGDALLKLPDRVELTRLQVAFCSHSVNSALIDYWRRQNPER